MCGCLSRSFGIDGVAMDMEEKMVQKKIQHREPGILTYGITPPKAGQPEEKIREIAERQMERINQLKLDALILYDIQDEQERTSAERPFPFMKTMDPGEYSQKYLQRLSVPHIIYRCVGKYTREELQMCMQGQEHEPVYSVFVGASSADQKVRMSLAEAYELAREISSPFCLGGVTIPERHQLKTDEHVRTIRKMDRGCRFFVSQAVYNVEASKNFLSDYYYSCVENERPMAPMIMTLTPCGSKKTLEFMKWLGVSIPRWLENELLHSRDILDRSIHFCLQAFEELFQFGMEKGIPIGCNVESVSVKKVEIEASIQLAKDISDLMNARIHQPHE